MCRRDFLLVFQIQVMLHKTDIERWKRVGILTVRRIWNWTTTTTHTHDCCLLLCGTIGAIFSRHTVRLTRAKHRSHSKQQQSPNCALFSLLQIRCDWWSPEVREPPSGRIWTLPAPRRWLSPTEQTSCSGSGFPANEEVIRSVSLGRYEPGCRRNWSDLSPPALKMNDKELHAI